jgi:hypothetical protein
MHRSRGRRAADVFRALTRSAIAAAAGIVLLAAPAAAASPSPSPTLGSVLVSPPASDFVTFNQYFTAVQGDFDALQYIVFLGWGNPSTTEGTLHRDGFVSGFGRSWVQPGTTHILLELVVAFSGGAGAKSWLQSVKDMDQNRQYFRHEISVNGIDQIYAAHYVDPGTPAYADILTFVKGNDYFEVAILSPSDDLADSGATQTKRQYDFAPASTIPPSQWPENGATARHDLVYFLLVVAPNAVLLALMVGLVLLTVGLIRRRSRARTPAYAVIPGEVQMSSDGYYWWDGSAWKDASQEPPPSALRSADGYYWWDGVKWRSVPEPPVS